MLPIVFCFLCSTTLFCSKLPPAPTTFLPKPATNQNRTDANWSPPDDEQPPQQHQHYSVLPLLQHLLATPNPEVWKFISWCPHSVKYSKALFNLLKFASAVPTLCMDIPSVRLCWLSQLPPCSQVPVSLPAGAAPSAHHPYLLSSATLQHSEGRRMLALLDHFLPVIPVPSVFQTVPFIVSDF